MKYKTAIKHDSKHKFMKRLLKEYKKIRKAYPGDVRLFLAGAVVVLKEWVKHEENNA